MYHKAPKISLSIKDTTRYLQHGVPYPFGAYWDEAKRGYNFSIWSGSATRVRLLLFRKDNPYTPVYEYELNAVDNKSGNVWHCFVDVIESGDADCYAYRINGPDSVGNFFNYNKLLLDPWAKAAYFPPDYCRNALRDEGDNMGRAPLGVLQKESDLVLTGRAERLIRDEDLIIYELHVKGFTQHESAGLTGLHRGTFSGITEKIPYLKELGINAVELMPVHQYDPQEGNYWGYMTMNFFAPHAAYSSSGEPPEAVEEFRAMIKALHDAGIEVILDVVYNHTAEADIKGPLFSYRGIDNAAYYLMAQGTDAYNDDAGTGNVLRTSHKIVRKLILDSLRFWAGLGVDGFRFDLATIFTRNDDGTVNLIDPPIIDEITMDPILSRLRLIAEPWDIASFQLGQTFPGKDWSQWNCQYRDDVRRFVKGDHGLVPLLMTRLYGSDNLFPDKHPSCCHPFQSVNFITAHDGFTLYDLVAYNHKHNLANGHGNTDGSDDNHSWNCGWEGDIHVPEAVMELRRRQAKNFIALLMLSNGTPMFRMGDEFMTTQHGNNNPYNQDNETSWLDWGRKEMFADVFKFFKMMIAFRKKHPSISRRVYWQEDVKWYGTDRDVDMSYHSNTLAYYLDGSKMYDADLYVMINSGSEARTFNIMEGLTSEWKLVIDTSLCSGLDIRAAEDAVHLDLMEYQVKEHSVVVLVRSRRQL